MNLYYREKGRGYPLIILHGLWGASDNWLQIAGLLANHFRVILPDLRNHGQSPHHHLMDYDAMSEDIREFIQQLNLDEKPFLVGHSMGGKVVMSLLLKDPDISAGNAIIDIAPAATPITSEHKRIIDLMMHTDLSRFTSRSELRSFLESRFHEEKIQHLLLKNILFTPGHSTWKINTTAISTHLNTLTGWESNNNTCDKDILFIKGETSPYIRGEEQLRKTFPAAHMITIPQAGHWIHAEQPERLSAAIADYFTAIQQASQHTSKPEHYY